MLPGFGPCVIGASWTPYDGHANPLNLLHALHKAFVETGGRYVPNTTIGDVEAAREDFRITVGDGEIGASKVVLAAGLGNAALAPLFGLSAPVEPQRGQILVTKRAQRVLAMPTTTIRQTVEGGIMLGDRQEDAGFDTGQKPAVMRTIARRAVLSFPRLRDLQIVRAWAALRVMPRDGLPIYDQSERFPGAFTANCHSGVSSPRRTPICSRRWSQRVGWIPPSTFFGGAVRCSGGGLTPIRRRSPSSSRDARP